MSYLNNYALETELEGILFHLKIEKQSIPSGNKKKRSAKKSQLNASRCESIKQAIAAQLTGTTKVEKRFSIDDNFTLLFVGVTFLAVQAGLYLDHNSLIALNVLVFAAAGAHILTQLYNNKKQAQQQKLDETMETILKMRHIRSKQD